MVESLASQSQHGLTVHASRAGERTRVHVLVIFRGRELVKMQFSLARLSVALGGLGWIGASFLDEFLVMWPQLQRVVDAVCGR